MTTQGGLKEPTGAQSELPTREWFRLLEESRLLDEVAEAKVNAVRVKARKNIAELVEVIPMEEFGVSPAPDSEEWKIRYAQSSTNERGSEVSIEDRVETVDTASMEPILAARRGDPERSLSLYSGWYYLESARAFRESLDENPITAEEVLGAAAAFFVNPEK